MSYVCVLARMLFLMWVLTVPDQAILPELNLSPCLFFLQSFLSPPAGHELLKLKAVIGYNGNGRGNMVWNPDTGTRGGLGRGGRAASPHCLQAYAEPKSGLAVGLGSLL